MFLHHRNVSEAAKRVGLLILLISFAGEGENGLKSGRGFEVSPAVHFQGAARLRDFGHQIRLKSASHIGRSSQIPVGFIKLLCGIVGDALD